MSRFGQGPARFQLGPQQIPLVIKHLLIATFAAFIVQTIVGIGGRPSFLERYGSLQASQFFSGMLWQPLTRLFLHSEVWHVAGNLFVLWMFGTSVAERWGYRRFMWLYFAAGVGGGLLQVGIAGAFHLLGGSGSVFAWSIPSLGASGAVYTIMALYALSWPDRQINLLFVPLTFESRWLIPIILGLELGFPAPNVSHEAHVIGVALAFVVLWLFGADGQAGRFGGPPASGSPKPGHLRVVRADDKPLFH